VSGTGETRGATGDQFYVTHCAVTDSVLNNPGYTVRAASTTALEALNAAFRYPPYELPIDMWKSLPTTAEAPVRLARTQNPAGGLWVVHSSYLPKDANGRDRSYFSHLIHLSAADPATVLRSWGSSWWATNYRPGAAKTLPGNAKLTAGTLVSDESVTAFLGDNPAGPVNLNATVCPARLRGSAAERRTLFARFLKAVSLLSEEKNPNRRRLYVHAEPGLIALMLYGAVRLLPQAQTDHLTFSTFEPFHRNIRGYTLADVVGTYLGNNKGLDPDIGTSRGLALDTVAPARSSPQLQKPLPELLTPAMSDLIKIAARGVWPVFAELHEFVDDDFDLDISLVGTVASPAAPGARKWGEAKAESPAAPAPPASPAGAAPPQPGTDPKPAGAAAPASSLPPRQQVGRMSYSAQISRTNPACLLFLIDQSTSMADQFIGGTGQPKASVVADALNRLIQNVVLRSAKADGIRDYFKIGVIGYGQGVKAGFGGSLPFSALVPISQLGAHPLRVETRTKLIPDGVGGTVEQKVKFPVWFDAEANGNTPMCEAFTAARLVVERFIEEFPDAFPPIVLNLTDGMPSDGNPQLNARLLANKGTSDGAALVFNLLITSKPVPADFFPATEDNLPDVFSKLLFRMSSVLPPKFAEAARAEGHSLAPNARGVVVNADPTAIVRFLDIGTRLTPGR
jgi:hypothetical protein